MKEEEKIILEQKVLTELPEKKIDDREEVTQLLFFKTEEKGKELVTVTQRFESEKRQMLSGEIFTIGELKEEFKKFISEIEKNYEPKFSLFLKRLGDLCKWTEEERKRYSKPRIAPITITELFYNRFPEGTIQYLREHNKYVGYCIRRTKNYKLLNEDGIIKLEQMIDDVNILMPQCRDYYDFRRKMFEKFKVPYQIELFNFSN